MPAKIIVFANEKGGTGKSTLAMHTIVALLRAGKSVASFDLDARQGSLTRYIENRRAFTAEKNVALPMPEHTCWTDDVAKIYTLRGQIDKALLKYDAVVIDTPGSHTPLGLEAMVMADCLVTPMNDSLVDLDILAVVDGDSAKIKGPSHFAQTVWSTRQQRMLERKPPIQWVVVRNRMLYNKSRNSQMMTILLNALSRRIHFVIAGGISERVVFRELFLKGLTMLDFQESDVNISATISSKSAQRELSMLLNEIWGDGTFKPAQPALP
ncbi:MAG: division plane positioning ATPase MipZ [Alphaproteobacteria bacterium]|nr:division plane positioning ATPase MipZ [Alphaproteobacteria bacterium]